MYPGYGTVGSGWEGYTGTQPVPHPRTHIELNLAIRPYPRPNEGYFGVFSEVSQIGSRKGPRMGPDMASE